MLCGIIDNQFVGPVIVDSCINRERYLHFLQNLLPEYLEDVPLATRAGMYLQQDGFHITSDTAACPGQWAGFQQNMMSPMAAPSSQLLQSASLGPATPAPMTPSSTDPGIVPTLQNIVSTVNLGCKLDLKKIALHARNAEYNPKRFAAVIMRIREPRTTALIFSSGKMVCTGAKSEEDSRLAARKYARIIQKLGFTFCLVDCPCSWVTYLMLGKSCLKGVIQLLAWGPAQCTAWAWLVGDLVQVGFS
ncbi:hypothetical protein PR048_002098 [Dryococelus australis]|uniref:TATA-box binding protein n=1 Tax=Dryococelus australis TaxID=614101 RepID=A0ABQ9ILS7_9NEOP|nr:hypothetical protein PR048_002098 [Dryococelus australis]